MNDSIPPSLDYKITIDQFPNAPVYSDTQPTLVKTKMQFLILPFAGKSNHPLINETAYAASADGTGSAMRVTWLPARMIF